MDKIKEKFDTQKINQNNNDKNSEDDNLFFYVMTLQTDNGEQHQIKIYENSDASELAFNFCKEKNLDFPTMKYLKKNIKQILLQFQNTKKNKLIYLFKDNNSIQEVAEEEIITDNSLKKSGTFKKNSSQNKKNKLTLEDEEELNSKNNYSKENIKNNNNEETNSNNNKDLNINKESEENLEEKNLENDNVKNNLNMNLNSEKNVIKDINNNKDNDFVIVKSKNSIDDDGQIEQKDFSIDYCIDNDSLQIISPTEHTTKIEQRSSIRNSSSLTKKKYEDYIFEKKNNSKSYKTQNTKSNYGGIYFKHNYYYNFNKLKKEKNIDNDININNNKFFSKKNSFNNKIIKRKPLSVEKKKRKPKNKTPLLELSLNNKKPDIIKQNKYKNYKNKYDKILKNMNYMKNKYFSNYYNYFIISNK